MYRVYSSPPIAGRHSVILRGAALAVGERPKKQWFRGEGLERLHRIFLTVFFNPLALRALPLYFLTETPRNATGHGRGRELKRYFEWLHPFRLRITSPLSNFTDLIRDE